MAKAAPNTGVKPIGKTYPIPVSNGIFEHRKKIGSAVWLFLLFIDWTTAEENGVGIVLRGKPIKLKDLMIALGLKERQVSAQLQRLKSRGYIQARRTPYGYVIDVMKSKKFINRDRHKVADHNRSEQQQIAGPDQQKTADHGGEISNFPQQRSAISCRNKEEITKNLTERESEESKKPIPSRSKKVPNPRLPELTAEWNDRYRSRCGGEPYPFSSKDFGLLKSALSRFPLPRLKELIRQFFETDDPWVVQKAGFTVGVFISRLPSLASIFAAKLNGHKPAELKEMTI